MQERGRIYIAPRRRALRIPPDYRSPDKLDSDKMLGAVMVALVMVIIVATCYWFFRRH